MVGVWSIRTVRVIEPKDVTSLGLASNTAIALSARCSSARTARSSAPFGLQNSTTAILPCLRALSASACLAGALEGPPGVPPVAVAPAGELARAEVLIAEGLDPRAELRSSASAYLWDSATAPWALSIARDRPA